VRNKPTYVLEEAAEGASNIRWPKSGKGVTRRNRGKGLKDRADDGREITMGDDRNRPTTSGGKEKSSRVEA